MSDEDATKAVGEVPVADSVLPTRNGLTNGSEKQPEPENQPEETSRTMATDNDQQNGDTAIPQTDILPESSNNATDMEKKGKRKSVANTPSKKLAKKKSMPVLHLDCKPGDYYWARMKGHPAWPAIIADESMLPEQILATRPVSAARPDGSLRADYMEGAKNAKERTYAVMYLATNEFSWINNTNLTPLEPTECKEPPKTKAKGIAEAYELAVEQPGLDYFKGLLEQAREEEQKIEEERQQAEAEALRKAEEKQAKGDDKKKKPRKSKTAEDEDVDMEDADAPKSTRKRKKGDESDGEAIKPKKTPKVTKLNGPKTPAEAETPTSKKTSKPKKKVAAPKAEEEVEDVKISEEEREAQLAKSILYFRHRLQKGFLARDESPKESEMATMAEYFAQLENYEDLPSGIIRQTKIHKVLKAIVKLSSIPKEEEYNFKKRSSALLEVWNKRMEADGEASTGRTTTAKDKNSEANGDIATAEETADKIEEQDKAQATGENSASQADQNAQPSTTKETSEAANTSKLVDASAANGESPTSDGA